MAISRISILAALLILGIWPAVAQTGAPPQPGVATQPVEPSSNANAEKQRMTRNLVLAVVTRTTVKGVVQEKIETIPLSTIKSTTNGAAPFTNTIRLSIPRYTDSYIYGLALFEYPWGAPCFWLESGEWTLSATGSDLGTARTFVETRLSPCQNTNAPFATVYYKWNSHTNHTRTPGDGPLDTFVGEWKASGFDLTYNFVVFVDAVRPVRETNEWKGWYDGGRGNWLPTLVAPDSDPAFDFSGETVKESHVNRSTCVSKQADATMGDPRSSTGVPNAAESTWTIKPGNLFDQPDKVGWIPCAVQFYRCTKAVGCGYVTAQTMSIKSPADTDFIPYTINTLKGYIERAMMIPFSNDQASFGVVSSQRGESPKQWKFYLSNKNSCAGYPGAKMSC